MCLYALVNVYIFTDFLTKFYGEKISQINLTTYCV